eukprot:5070085-Prorocentrum_lima.AAC.1
MGPTVIWNSITNKDIFPNRTACPVRQEASGTAVRHLERQSFGTLHMDLAGPFEIQGERGHTYLLMVAHRVKTTE